MIYGFLRQVRAFRFPSSTRLAALATALALGSILWACSTPTDTESMADEQAVATQTPAADLAALLDTIGPEVAKLRGLREWGRSGASADARDACREAGIGVRR